MTELKTPDDFLLGQEKPTCEQVAWVFAHLYDHLTEEVGTFRYLIYNRMGFDRSAYCHLYAAGGMQISNAFAELEAYEERAAGNCSLIDLPADFLCLGLKVYSANTKRGGVITDIGVWRNGGEEHGQVALQVAWENGDVTTAPICDFMNVFAVRDTVSLPLDEEEQITLTGDEAKTVLDLVENPPEPNEALKKAVAKRLEE